MEMVKDLGLDHEEAELLHTAEERRECYYM